MVVIIAKLQREGHVIGHQMTNKQQKCSVSSIPLLVGHVMFTVSLELCLNLWKFSLLRPTLDCERQDEPNWPQIPKIAVAEGQILDRTFFIKTATDGDRLVFRINCTTKGRYQKILSKFFIH